LTGGARAAIEAETTVGADRNAGGDAFDVVLDVVMRVEKRDHSVVDDDALDGRRVPISATWRRGFGRSTSLAPQGDAEQGAVEDELGHVRVARPQACKRDVGLDAADCEAAAAITVIRSLQRHVAHRDVE
jgi:hypothetical protein